MRIGAKIAKKDLKTGGRVVIRNMEYYPIFEKKAVNDMQKFEIRWKMRGGGVVLGKPFRRGAAWEKRN